MTSTSQMPSKCETTTSETQDQSAFTPVYVLIPPSPLFAAHWSFFLPDVLPFNAITKRHEESNTGRRIHVSGDRLNGFKLEIIREYDIRKHTSVGNRRFPIAMLRIQPFNATKIGEQHLKDEDEGGGYIDNVATDEFENICVEVEAPGKSLRSAGEVGGRKEVKDCQWWVKEVVRIAFDRGILLKHEEGRNPLDVVTGLPKH